MSKRKNISIAVIIAVMLVFIMIFANFRSPLVRQLQGPAEGTGNVLTIDNELAVISKNNNIYTWQWGGLSAWPVVSKPQAQIVIPVGSDKIIYNPLSNSERLILTNLKADKELAGLSLPYGAECKRLKVSQNRKFGAVSIVFKEGVQKDWLKLGLFDSDLKNVSFVFQKDTNVKDFMLNDFSVTDDAAFLAGAGEKGQAWVFVIDMKSENILWEKVFPEYDRFTLAEFSPDGKMLFVAEKVRYIIALDSATGQTIKVFEMPIYHTPAHQKQNICCIAISPDGKTLAADTEPAGTVWFWDIETSKAIGKIGASVLTVSGIAFSSDSKYLATGCMVSPEIKIWKVPKFSH